MRTHQRIESSFTLKILMNALIHRLLIKCNVLAQFHKKTSIEITHKNAEQYAFVYDNWLWQRRSMVEIGEVS